jgi:hypothetical protein
MMSENESASTGRGMYWTGVVLSAIPSLMLLMASVMTLSHGQQVVEGMTKYGFPPEAINVIGISALVSVILYIIPSTAVLGAVLMTGYLGGAVATHVHAAEWANAPVPVVVGVLVWGGLFFRDARIRALLPWRK